ncbi:MAG: histidinol-phosphate transaminase [Rhodospirillales bacterium]|nr:histidinol-phosphate transaminase [Rhodospirillales bacterium]
MSAPEPRPGIMDIAPYVGGESAIAGKRKAIKLSSNEGAFGPSPRAVIAYKKAAATLHRYPDGSATELRKAIAARHGLDPERVVCGAGSDELLILMCKAYAGPGDEVLYTEHGFLIYPIAAKAAGATPVKVAEKQLTADVDALVKRAGAKTRLLFIANPNNPTGTYLPADELMRLRERLPRHVILVIDAAYAEFVTHNDYSPGIELVDGGDNVVMTRTFSKIFGLGGARLGWAYCPAPIAHVLNLVRGPFNVSAPAMAAGLAALDDVAFTNKARAHNTVWRAWSRERLLELGLEVPESACNFVLVRFPAAGGRDAKAADAFLKARGIIVRRVAAYGLPDCLRVTIGLEDEMRTLVDALREFTKSWGSR